MLAPSIESKKANAEECLSELVDAVLAARNALESLEGAIADANSLEGLDVTWDSGEPEIGDILSELIITGAEFSYSEDLLES